MQKTAFALLALSALCQAQGTEGDAAAFNCPKPNSAYCAGASLSSNIIFRCDASGKAAPGNCNDNLAGIPPVGVKTSALCYQESPDAGNAACSFDGIVYPSDGRPQFPIPSGSSTPSTHSSSSTHSSKSVHSKSSAHVTSTTAHSSETHKPTTSLPPHPGTNSTTTHRPPPPHTTESSKPQPPPTSQGSKPQPPPTSHGTKTPPAPPTSRTTQHTSAPPPSSHGTPTTTHRTTGTTSAATFSPGAAASLANSGIFTIAGLLLAMFGL